MAKYINNLAQLEDLCHSYQKSQLPRIIHQTYKSEILPEHWQPSKDSWLKLHPNWLYVLWTDEMLFELVEKYYPAFYEKFLSYPYFIQKVDAARVFILHRYGGIYSDLDLQALRSMEELDWDNLNEEVYLLSNQGRFTNMFMISQKEADFWLEVEKEMLNPAIPWYLGLTRHFYILTTTGPFVIDRVANKYDKSIGYLPSKLFQPCGNCDPKPCHLNDSYLSMLDGGSWGSFDSVLISTCCCNWHILIWILVILILIIAIALIIYYR